MKIKNQMIIEALESYIQRLRECDANEVAISSYVDLLNEFEEVKLTVEDFIQAQQ
jgi:hypothetical protein